MHSCLCLRSWLSRDESMFDNGSMAGSHVFSEAQSLSYFSKALTAEVETVLSHDRTVLAASLARPAAFAEFSLFLQLDLGHGLLTDYLCSEIVLHEYYSLFPGNVVTATDS